MGLIHSTKSSAMAVSSTKPNSQANIQDTQPLPKKQRTKSPGVRIIGGRIYDSQNGKTCHQVVCFFGLIYHLLGCWESMEKWKKIRIWRKCLVVGLDSFIGLQILGGGRSCSFFFPTFSVQPKRGIFLVLLFCEFFNWNVAVSPKDHGFYGTMQEPGGEEAM